CASNSITSGPDYW
nr:immunoglobulin heavy chain junction region [Macaca mulatta]MOX59503.1 immunoglobulin heavy chain junction region [Macaca mulatta]MOX61835.1 immunoglobulin heavy chain junction region [Macaca mulatta]MOX61838.1 immunoglobulin heavy chain junction region [Macaca mulatta]MOX62363.1 immunoglobulin heavy chain junction region [Macaca mulatta]